MNMIMLLIVAAVVFAYYGGASCPKVLKDNKQMLLGVVVGLLLGSFLGVRIEGITTGNGEGEPVALPSLGDMFSSIIPLPHSGAAGK